MPKIFPTASNFGSVSKNIFGSVKPVTALVADQQSAAFGHHLTGAGAVKLTLGTGAFLAANSGSKLIFDNEENIYTLIGWKFDAESPVYLTETAVDGYAEVIAACLDRGVNLHLPTENQPDKIDENLCTVLDGWEKDSSYCSEFSEAYRALIQIADLIAGRIGVLSNRVTLQFPLRVDGGLSNSTALLSILATLLQETVARPVNCEMTSYGTALIAGT